MALSDLKNKIIQEAKDRRDKAIAAAELQAQKNLEQNKEKLKKEHENAIQRIKDTKSLRVKREKSKQLLEFNRNLSILKHEIINSLLTEYATHFVNNQNLYSAWLLKLAKKYCQPSDKIILTREEDRKILNDFPLSSEVRKGLGGIYIQKKRIEMNLTIEEFLRRTGNEKRREIYDLLFTESATKG